MKPKPLLLFILLAGTGTYAQPTLKFQTGLGYLEHFSVGLMVDLNLKNSLGVTYGSDFFYKPQHFSTVFIKYNRLIPTLTYRRITPGIGAKSGYTIFTDSYYTWKVISAVPFVSIQYKANNRIDLVAEGGFTFSRIESVTRLNYGEIGKYKRYLPELNFSIHYSIFKRKSD